MERDQATQKQLSPLKVYETRPFWKWASDRCYFQSSYIWHVVRSLSEAANTRSSGDGTRDCDFVNFGTEYPYEASRLTSNLPCRRALGTGGQTSLVNVRAVAAQWIRSTVTAPRSRRLLLGARGFFYLFGERTRRWGFARPCRAARRAETTRSTAAC